MRIEVQQLIVSQLIKSLSLRFYHYFTSSLNDLVQCYLPLALKRLRKTGLDLDVDFLRSHLELLNVPTFGLCVSTYGFVAYITTFDIQHILDTLRLSKKTSHSM